RRRSGSGDASCQLKPAEPRRGLTVAGKRTAVSDEFDVPAVRCDPGDEEGQGSFGELQVRFTGPMGGDEEVTGNFRSIGFRPPDSLPFADGPARFGQVGGRPGRGCPTGAAAENRDQPEQQMQFAWAAPVEVDHWMIAKGDVARSSPSVTPIFFERFRRHLSK